MAGNISRLKVWVKEKLKYSDLNREFNNIISGMTPAGVDDYSANAAEYQSAVAPVTAAGAFSSPTSLAGELERLRYQILRMTGKTYWYNDPGRVLSVAPQDLCSYITFTGGSASEAVANVIRRGALINALSLTSENLLAAHLASNSPVNVFSLILGTAVLAIPAKEARRTGTISLRAKDLGNGNYFAYNPLLGIELYQDSSKVVAKFTSATASTETAKVVNTITGTTDVTAASFEHIALTYSVDVPSMEIFKSLGTASLSSQGTSAAAMVMNSGTGGLWFFGAKKNAITFDHSVANSAEPDAMTDLWTLVGTNNAAVAGGVLAISTALNADNLYTKTTNIDLARMTVEAKVKVGSGGDYPFSGATICDITDLSLTRGLRALLRQDGKLEITAGTGSGTTLGFLYLNSQDYNLIRITSADAGGGDQTVNVYINGALAGIFLNNVEDNSGDPDKFKFGVEASVYGDAQAYFEFLGYKGSGAVVAPVSANSAGGYIDDMAVISSLANTAVLAQLKNNAARVVYGHDPKPGSYMPAGLEFRGNASTGAGVVTGTRIYFAADGESSYNYRLSAQVGATHADVDCTLALDTVNYFTLAHDVGVGSRVPIDISLSSVPAQGVHSLGVMIINASGTSVNLVDGQIGVSRS